MVQGMQKGLCPSALSVAEPLLGASTPKNTICRCNCFLTFSVVEGLGFFLSC